MELNFLIFVSYYKTQYYIVILLIGIFDTIVKQNLSYSCNFYLIEDHN